MSRFFVIRAVAGKIKGRPANKGKAAHGLHLSPHHRQQPQHIRMMGNRRTGGAVKRCALNPGLGIINRLLIAAFSHRQPLQTNREAGMVHHAEHNRQAFIFFADQIADRAARLAILHNSGRRGLDAQLFFDRQAAHIIARPEAAICIDKKLRHNKDRNTLHPFRRVRGARQNQMNDVFGHIMFTIGDVDFLACDEIMIVVFHRTCFDRRQICAGLWFSQIHGPGPAPLYHRRQKALFLVF